ncbi:MAG TPA: invasin domain 3-containing protein [Dehalococcoidia bacterium]|nr:invasin domain 3-containing protein [Dehalococcoidia bacterium]
MWRGHFISNVLLVGVVVAAIVSGSGAWKGGYAGAQEATPTAQPQASGSFEVIGISPLLCFLLVGTNPEAGQVDPVQCQQFDTAPSSLKRMDALLGDGDGRVEPTDFTAIDLDGNQVHQMDDWAGNTSNSGSLWIIAFVNDDDPVTFRTSRGMFVPGNSPPPGIPPTSSDPVDNEWTCDNRKGVLAQAEDEDCDGDGVAGDGVVVARLRARYGDRIADRGPGTVEIRQGSDVATMTFTVVGEPDSVEFLTLESTVQTGVVDLDDDGKLGSEGECPLETTAAGFLAANATAERAIVLGIVRDEDGNAITGSLLLWDTDDHDKAVMAAPLTPTLDLGTFGFGAPNLICGTQKAGTVQVLASISRDIPSPPAPTKIPNADPQAELDSGKKEFTVKGAPDSIQLKAEPQTLACDGQNASTVTATVLDKNGDPVAAGTRVRFDVRVLGTASPINATTNAEGVATSKVVPVAGGAAGVPVHVSAIVKGVRIDVDEDAIREQIAQERGIDPDDVPDRDVQERVEQIETEAAKDRVMAEASILISCTAGAAPGAAPPPPAPPAPAAPTPSGQVAPAARQPGLPRSGDAIVTPRASLPLWALLAAGLGATLLTATGFAVRRRM